MTDTTGLDELRGMVDRRIRPAGRWLGVAVRRAFGRVERPSPGPLRVHEVRERSGRVSYSLADGRGVGIIDDGGTLRRADAEFLATAANLHARLLAALAAVARSANALNLRDARRLAAQAASYEPPWITSDETASERDPTAAER